MADAAESRRWIVDPPTAPGEVSLHLAVGDGVGLTADQEAALSALLRTLEAGDPEVVGHSANCPKKSFCDPLSCTKMSCSPLECLGLSRAASAATVPAAAAGWNLMGSFRAGAG